MPFPGRGVLGVCLVCAWLASAALMGCASGEVETPGAGAGPPSAGGGGNGGGNPGGGGSSSCAQDCTAIDAPQCLQSVCNEGQYQGVVGQCVVVPQDMGASCDDGMFCTVDDACDGMGQCVGGPPNDCGMDPAECNVITCDEASKSCVDAPGPNGTPCQDPSNLCLKGSTCNNGACIGGTLDDCFFFPVPNECHIAVCNPMNGMCEPVVGNEGGPCTVGDLCMVDKICAAGVCQGGTPKDCSALDIGCNNGVCDPPTGNCVQTPVPSGGMCNTGSDQCNVGICDSMQVCVPNPVMNGTPCNDYNSCTQSDLCTNGVCGGTINPNCTLYFEDNFEAGCAAGWTLEPEWECGTPTNVGPPSCYEGNACVGTDLDNTYEDNETYATSYAESPTIGLGLATGPVLAYRHWVETEGSIFDCYNLKISVNGGSSFSVLTTVDPPYNLTVSNEPCWGGLMPGWSPVTADLSAYAGQNIILRWSFETDSSVVYPGVYIDDVAVGELIITTGSIPNGYVNTPYSTTLEWMGGMSSVTWSIVGGSNHGWLSINPSTGVLSGTPTSAGPVIVTVRATDPVNSNVYVDETYSFSVLQAIYAETFEGGCPNGWTLNSEWQCGVPTSGPMAALSGTQCIATILNGDYSNNLTWTGTTADSPTINLASTTAPQLDFWVWYETETSFDGFNVKVSTNGGMSYTLIQNVSPAYNDFLDNESCWSGGPTSGWVKHTVNLTAYAGQQIKLRFAFTSDGSVVYPGVYIDDVVVAD